MRRGELTGAQGKGFSGRAQLRAAVRRLLRCPSPEGLGKLLTVRLEQAGAGGSFEIPFGGLADGFVWLILSR